MEGLQGTIQLVVSLKTASVEYSMEVGDNRYGKTLNSDMLAATEILAEAKECGELSDGADEREFLKLTFAQLDAWIKRIDEMTRFDITKCGNKVYIPAREISFITLKTDGVFREIQEELE